MHNLLNSINLLLYNPVLFGTIWYNLIHFSTITRPQYTVVHSGTIRDAPDTNLVQFGTIWYSLGHSRCQSSAIFFNLVRFGTFWYNLIQSGTFWTILVRSEQSRGARHTPRTIRRRHEGNTESHTETQKCYFSLIDAHHHTRHVVNP